MAAGAGLANAVLQDGAGFRADPVPIVTVDVAKRLSPRLVQLGEPVATTVGLQGYRWTGAPLPWRRALDRGFGPQVALEGRPRHWLTIGGSLWMVFTRTYVVREARPRPDTPVDQATRLSAPPTARLTAVSLEVTFHN